MNILLFYYDFNLDVKVVVCLTIVNQRTLVWKRRQQKYDIEYIPGKSNIKADSWSRNRNATDFESLDNWEEGIYAISILNNANYKTQLSDILITLAMKNIENNNPITKGKT